jgi:uncharacterized protein YfiM (DUF2279 family)
MIRMLALVVSMHWGDEHPGGDRWFSPDKAKHFFLAAFVQSAAYSSLRTVGLNSDASLGGASAVSATLSIGKELRDRRQGGGISAKDLVWDAAGIAGASVLLRRAR